MTDTNLPLKDRPLRSDDDLRDLLELLIQRANQRQMWLLFIDERGCLGDPIMPMADYPDDPAELTRADDLGELTHARLLMHRAGMLCEITGNVQIALAWERIGANRVDVDDQAWARAMHEAAADLGIPLRAQFLVHSRGVRQLRLDDYL